MIYMLVSIIVVLIVYVIISKNKGSDDDCKVPETAKLPYHLSDRFLSPTELSFYQVLKQYIDNRVVICPKVGLKDFFFVGKESGKDYLKYFGKISQKHVDFLLCDPKSMKPICGIELDDSSHTSKKSNHRDQFVEKLYNEAQFPLVRFSSKSGYSLSEFDSILGDLFKNKVINVAEETVQSDDIICPKCHIPMILRKSTKGDNAGKEFYGCSNFPNCRELINKA